MELIIYPDNSFKNSEKENLNKIINFSKNLLQKNNINLPNKICFYNSFSTFIKKVVPEVESYGFNKKTSKEIIKCALNHGTYGTINYKDNSIIEMNFNPFNKGQYSSLEFLELIIHESLHLNLSKRMHKDINNLKFKFKKNKYIGKEKIIQLDEGYAEFMTKKILKRINIKKIKKIKIPIINSQKPKYKKQMFEINIKEFDKNFEKLLTSNRNKGLKLFEKKFYGNNKNEDIFNFVVNKLRKII